MNVAYFRSLYGKPAILDNNVISDFLLIDSLWIINRVFGKIGIPESILEEEVIEQKDKVISEIVYTAVSMKEDETFTFFREVQGIAPELTDNDVECIALARERAVLCSTNERKMVDVCNTYGIESTGTIGILSCAFERGFIDRRQVTDLILALFSHPERWYSKAFKKTVCEYYGIPYPVGIAKVATR